MAVKAVSVNPIDTKRRRWDDPPAGDSMLLLGYDAAGVVEAVGPEVTLFEPGDEVSYAGPVDRPGSNAEYQIVDERIVGPKMQSLSFAEAAAMPLTSITAWEILFDRMRVPQQKDRPAGSLLVLNGAGGVGSIMIQLAKQLTGLTVIGTASRPETIQWVKSLGADHVVEHRRPIDEGVKDAGFDGVDYVAAITTTSGSIPGMIRALKPQGHVNFIYDFEGSAAPFKMKSLTISWEMMFTRPLFNTPDMIEQHKPRKRVSELMDSGIIRSTATDILRGINADSLRSVHELSKAEKLSARPLSKASDDCPSM